MTIEEFWNQAFLAALTRLPAKKAKTEADEATQLCIDHWHANVFNWSPENMPRVQDVDIARAFRPAPGRENIQRGHLSLKAAVDGKPGRKRPATRKHT